MPLEMVATTGDNASSESAVHFMPTKAGVRVRLYDGYWHRHLIAWSEWHEIIEFVRKKRMDCL